MTNKTRLFLVKPGTELPATSTPEQNSEHTNRLTREQRVQTAIHSMNGIYALMRDGAIDGNSFRNIENTLINCRLIQRVPRVQSPEHAPAG